MAVFGRLKWDTLAYGTALAVDRIAGFLLLPILTAAWRPEIFAAWSQILVAYAFLSNILLVGFYHSVVRFIHGIERDLVGKIFHGMLGVILLNCAVFLVGVTFCRPYLSAALFASRSLESIVLPGSFYVVSEAIFEFVLLGFMRADGKIVACSVYYALKNVVRLATLGALATYGIATALTALVAVNVGLSAMAYVLHIAPSFEYSSNRLEAGFWPRLFGYSLPIVASGNVSWANAFVNRFLLVHFLGLADLAVYALNYSVASIVHVAAMCVNFLLVPRVNAAWNAGDTVQVCRLLKMATEYYLFGAVPLAVAIGVLYPQLLAILAPTSYGGGPVLMAMLIAFMVLLGLEQILLFATLIKNSYFGLGVRVAALIVNVVLNVLLIRQQGLVGSVFAGNVALGVTILLSIWYLQKAVAGYAFPWRAVGELVVAGAVMLGGGLLVAGWLPAAAIPALLLGGTVCGLLFLGAESLRAHSIVRMLVGLVRERKHAPGGAGNPQDAPLIPRVTGESPNETLFPRQ